MSSLSSACNNHAKYTLAAKALTGYSFTQQDLVDTMQEFGIYFNLSNMNDLIDYVEAINYNNCNA